MEPCTPHAVRVVTYRRRQPPWIVRSLNLQQHRSYVVYRRTTAGRRELIAIVPTWASAMRVVAVLLQAMNFSYPTAQRERAWQEFFALAYGQADRKELNVSVSPPVGAPTAVPGAPS